MTQDERWLEKYNEVKNYFETNKRNPSKHDLEERFKSCNWIKHNKKLMKAGGHKPNKLRCFRNCSHKCRFLSGLISINN